MGYGMVPDPQQPGDFHLSRQDQPPAGGQPKAPATPIASDRYCCSSCEAPIATELVIRVEAERRSGPGAGAAVASSRATTGYMLITHLCPCSPLVLTSRRYRSYRAFVALFGRGVTLPYESPFEPTTVADDHPSLLRWRWELAQTTDVDDFLYWLEHNRRRP